MTRWLLAGGALIVMLGVGLLVPAILEWLEQETISNLGLVVVLLAGALIICGVAAMLVGRRRWSGFAMPAPVRAVVTANLLFLAFCALETSDGVFRQHGRMFYWTSVLFVPALLLQYGLVSARRWAWWTARGLTAFFVLWFVGFMALIPFADLRGSDGPVPWWGRMYMVGVSLLFAGTAAYTFLALGHRDARRYFSLMGSNGAAKPSQALEPAAGQVSHGEPSPPVL